MQYKFRGKRNDNNKWIYGLYYKVWNNDHYQHQIMDTVINSLGEPNYSYWKEVLPETVGMWTGLKDKNGVEIYEGDILIIRKPIRTTQTHEGDNIPLGSYTEPLEPAIEEVEAVVRFGNGFYSVVEDEDETKDSPLGWEVIQYDIGTMKDGFAGGWVQYRENSNWSWGGEDGDLNYLLDMYKLKTEDELLKYVGIEVVGNIHDVNPASGQSGVNHMFDPNTVQPASEPTTEQVQAVEQEAQEQAMESAEATDTVTTAEGIEETGG